jgi:arginyl-tRNA synthetase
MFLPYKGIEERLQGVVKNLLPDADASTALVRPCPDPKFGDYQSNALMALARARKLNPRQLAADVLAKLDVSEWCDKVEIAGAGFLNFRLKPLALARSLAAADQRPDLFLEKAECRLNVVVDFSSPNVAKSMHVGHIRSTILGDSLARVLRLLGHSVITDNHLGDWGTQFGMLLTGWKTLLNREALQTDPLTEMERIYKDISGHCDPEKPGFEEATLQRARAELVKLQAGDPENLAIWKEMIRLSENQFHIIYARLGVQFDYTLGESFYHSLLQGIVDDLVRRGIAKESRGAKAVFSDGSLPPKDDPFLIHKEGEWLANPLIVQKQDGAFNYATTDLATLAHRVDNWHADEIIYVTDGRQQLHFRQLFATFRRWRPEVKTKLAHVWFGSILGEDGRPFKTRSGEIVRLSELLDEAEERALRIVSEKNPQAPEAERSKIARIVGVGAVKYADLLPNRQTDYVFSWDKMLALNGNTAPYLQYAYARIQSIFRKGSAEQRVNLSDEQLAARLQAPQEIALAKHLLNLDFVIEAVAEEYRPNFLCNYLYEVAGYFTAFYENCPVLKSEPAQREARLLLCDLTARVLKLGLGVLGIEVLDQM